MVMGTPGLVMSGESSAGPRIRQWTGPPGMQDGAALPCVTAPEIPMLLLNTHPDHGQPLLPEDAETLGAAGAAAVEAQIRHRENYDGDAAARPAGLAAQLGVGAIQVKDEGHRLGLGSFKALGGSYVVVKLVLEEAGRRLGRPVDIAELQSPR